MKEKTKAILSILIISAKYIIYAGIVYLVVGYCLANLFCRPWGYCEENPRVSAPILNPQSFILGR